MHLEGRSGKPRSCNHAYRILQPLKALLLKLLIILSWGFVLAMWIVFQRSSTNHETLVSQVRCRLHKSVGARFEIESREERWNMAKNVNKTWPLQVGFMRADVHLNLPKCQWVFSWWSPWCLLLVCLVVGTPLTYSIHYWYVRYSIDNPYVYCMILYLLVNMEDQIIRRSVHQD
jgi:hypothetical protein